MGSHCTFCKDTSDSKLLEVEEHKRERVKFQTVLQEDDLISLKSLSFQSPPPIRESTTRLVAKRYLAQKYLKVAKTLSKSETPYKLLYSPLPNFPDESSKIPTLYSYLYIKDRRLTVLPAIQLSSGCIYEGQWNLERFKPEGYGVLIEKDKGKYSGLFKDGRKHGQGQWVLESGDVYTCEFNNDTIEGSGTLARRSGLVYTGQFKDGKEHGTGVIRCDGEEIYEGEFEAGLKHGNGKLKINEGSFYVGEFCKDLMHGNGTYTWADGKRYEGSWKENQVHGEGKYQWPDGSEYCGCYKDGNRDGYGVFQWPDGREYRGEWKMGVMHGVGSYKCQDSSGVFRTVKGVWQQGKKVK